MRGGAGRIRDRPGEILTRPSTLTTLTLLLLALPAAVALAGAAAPTCPRGVWVPVLAQARVATLRNDTVALRNFFQIVAKRDDLPGLTDRTRGLSRDSRIRTAPEGSAEIVVAAAEALADIGGACAGCHQRSGGGPSFDEAEVPEHVSGTVAHMARHQWAVDRLWEGLMAPSDPRWAAGVAALHDHALDAETMHGESGGESPSDFLDWWIHQRGPVEAAAATPAARGETYAALMEACAACHAGTAGAPGMKQP